MIREIRFYQTRSGRSPVQEFLDSLPRKQFEKIFATLHRIESAERVSSSEFMKLTDTSGLWEVRVRFGRDAFRILAFFDGPRVVVLATAFAKKSQKTPPQEIELAEKRKRDYLSRRDER